MYAHKRRIVSWLFKDKSISEGTRAYLFFHVHTILPRQSSVIKLNDSGKQLELHDALERKIAECLIFRSIFRRIDGKEDARFLTFPVNMLNFLEEFVHVNPTVSDQFTAQK